MTYTLVDSQTSFVAGTKMFSHLRTLNVRERVDVVHQHHEVLLDSRLVEEGLVSEQELDEGIRNLAAAVAAHIEGAGGFMMEISGMELLIVVNDSEWKIPEPDMSVKEMVSRKLGRWERRLARRLSGTRTNIGTANIAGKLRKH